MIILLHLLLLIVGISFSFYTFIKYKKMSKLGYKQHFKVLIRKFFIYIIIISMFIFFADSQFRQNIVIYGMLNILIFHFIDGMIVQKKLIKNVNFYE